MPGKENQENYQLLYGNRIYEIREAGIGSWNKSVCFSTSINACWWSDIV